MTARQKLELRRSEIRERLGEIAALEGDALTDEIRTEAETLGTELRDSELKLRCAIQAEGGESEEREVETPDAEERERLELRSRARVGAMAAAVISGRAFEGAEAEVQEAYGLADHVVPLEMFEPREAEDRAATPAPGGTQVNEQPAQPFVYRGSVAGFLGIDLPVLEPGAAAFPVLTTRTPSGAVAKGADADETAAAFTVATSTPKRIAGAFRVRREDVATFPQLEDALRRDIPMSLADSLDEQVLNGDGAGANITGLLARLGDAAAPAAGVPTPADYVSRLAGSLDGRHGYQISDLRAVVGKVTYAQMVGAYFDNTAVSIAAYLAEHMGGVRMSDRLAAPAGNIQKAVVRVGMMPNSIVCGVWGGIELIRDMYSSARAGEVVVTASQLISDVHVLQAGSIVETSFRTGA